MDITEENKNQRGGCKTNNRRSAGKDAPISLFEKIWVLFWGIIEWFIVPLMACPDNYCEGAVKIQVEAKTSDG